MTFYQLLEKSLKAPTYEDFRIEVQILIEEAFKLAPNNYWIHKDRPVPGNHPGWPAFRSGLKRLGRREPLAYILGKKEFYSLEFRVNRDVLIPRPETEIMVEQVIPLVREGDTILDIGAGSGNISVTLAKHTRGTVTAVEKSRKAITVLKQNIVLHGVEDRVFLKYCNLFPGNDIIYDFIVSNPPYVKKKDWEKLDDGIKRYEPSQALIGGEKGYEILEKIIRNSVHVLRPEGYLFLEIGYDQKDVIHQFLVTSGYSKIKFHCDYNRIPRIVQARR